MAMALKGSCGGVSVRAPARSLAERARGFRAISCSLGPDRPSVMASNVAVRARLRSADGASRRRAAGARGEELLHDAVFERMERHDDEAPAGLQDALRRMQRAHEFAELVVDGDAQPLEHARRRMNAAGLLADGDATRSASWRVVSKAGAAASSMMARATARARRSSP